MPDGSINGWNLSQERPIVRNYTTSNIPIKVHGGLTAGSTGLLRIVLDGNQWGSTISFDPGVPVTLNGTLPAFVRTGHKRHCPARPDIPVVRLDRR